ncbi:MAG: hypothetical protein LAP13_24525 [Acidobacteriia bacterium]|nr:hypothetical protein [Terriglobia bacterium]
MKKTTAFTTLLLLSSMAVWAKPAAARSARATTALEPPHPMQAGAQAAEEKKPQWKSREEYDAFQAVVGEKDPNKKIADAEAFLKKYETSDFKYLVYLTEMQAYAQLNKSEDAIAAARNALKARPDSIDTIDGLAYLAYTFPFTFKADDPEASAKLTEADSWAKSGLQLLQNFKKPDNVTDEQFQAFVKPKRAVFNSTAGFVALQQKNYSAAITSLKAATDDNPSSWYSYYWMGLAYLYATPRDYDHGIWYYARAVSLAKAAKDPNAEGWEKYLKQTYVSYHGTDTGLSDVIAQAAASPNPPEGFKVAPVEAPKATGNAMVDAFNQMTFPLKLGGDTAQKQWDQIKGQPLELGGTIQSVDKGTDAGTYLVHIAILDTTKSVDGYDVELKDTTQPNVKNLAKGDLVVFKGTLDSYSATPNLILSLSGSISKPDPLPDKPEVKAKPKPKPAPRKRPARRKTTGR